MAGCLGSDDSTPTLASAPTPPTVSSDVRHATAPMAPSLDATVPLPTGDARSENTPPVWQANPAIQFVEGVPAVIPIRQFVVDRELDAVVIQLRAGALPPGMTWNPIDATVTYDGRPFGASAGEPLIVGSVTFSADDGN